MANDILEGKLMELVPLKRLLFAVRKSCTLLLVSKDRLGLQRAGP